MNLFLPAVICLVAGALLMLLRPWSLHGSRESTARDINARLYGQQLAELERDRAAGTLTLAEYSQIRAELHRRMLDDAIVVDPAVKPANRTQRTPLVLAVLLPLAAAALYAWLGTPAAVLHAPEYGSMAQASDPDPMTAQLEQMVARLAARLETNPDDAKGWSMLAASYVAMGRYREAANAYSRIRADVLNDDAALLSGYADTLATLAGGNIEGRPLQLVRAALELDPDQPMALSLAANAAYRRGDFPEAARHWQRLLKQLPPDSEDARMLRKTLAEIVPSATSAPQR